MNKLELIELLSSIKIVCENEKDDEDRRIFEPRIKENPEIGTQCLKIWMSKYYVSLNSWNLILKYQKEPTWNNFHLASHFLMIDRIIAAVALDGNVTSQVKECIDLTLKCGNIKQEHLTWIEYYSGVTRCVSA